MTITIAGPSLGGASPGTEVTYDDAVQLVRGVQQKLGITADGRWGAGTSTALVSALRADAEFPASFATAVEQSRLSRRISDKAIIAAALYDKKSALAARSAQLNNLPPNVAMGLSPALLDSFRLTAGSGTVPFAGGTTTTTGGGTTTTTGGGTSTGGKPGATGGGAGPLGPLAGASSSLAGSVGNTVLGMSQSVAPYVFGGVLLVGAGVLAAAYLMEDDDEDDGKDKESLATIVQRRAAKAARRTQRGARKLVRRTTTTTTVSR